jgi:hypothetical protein
MSLPTTEAGMILLAAFFPNGATPDAILLNTEAVIRHALPKIEAEARTSALMAFRERVEGLACECVDHDFCTPECHDDNGNMTDDISTSRVLDLIDQALTAKEAGG